MHVWKLSSAHGTQMIDHSSISFWGFELVASARVVLHMWTWKLVYLYSDVLMHHWQGRPSLVFCSTRRGAQEAAVTLAETALKLGTQNPFIKSQEQYQRLQDAANLTNERQLQQCINCGGTCSPPSTLLIRLFILQSSYSWRSPSTAESISQYTVPLCSCIPQWWTCIKRSEPCGRVVPEGWSASTVHNQHTCSWC